MDFKNYAVGCSRVLSATTTVGTLHYFDGNHDTNGDFNYFHSSRKDGQFASLNAVALGMTL